MKPFAESSAKSKTAFEEMIFLRRLVPLFLMLALIVNVSVCAAEANSSKSVKKVGVVIIADDTFKKEKFFEAAKDIAPKSKDCLVKVGDEIQSLWGDYCAEKNISPDKPPKTAEFMDFVARNNFHRVLALVVQEVHSSEYRKTAVSGNPARFPEGGSAIMQLSGYMFDNSNLLKTFSSVNKRYSEFSLLNQAPEARAKIGVFRLCVKVIGQNMKDAW